MSELYLPEKPRPTGKRARIIERQKRISASIGRIAVLEREIEMSEMQTAYWSTRP